MNSGYQAFFSDFSNGPGYEATVLFFLSYIIDLACITFFHGTQILLFANDIMLYKPVSNDQDIIDFQTGPNLITWN